MFESTSWILEEPTIADTSKYDLLVPTIVKENSPEKEVGILIIIRIVVLENI